MWLQWCVKSVTVAVLHLVQEETNKMVNQPGKLAVASQLSISKGGEDESYEQLLDQYTGRRFAEGEVMKGTVLKITSTDVVVDIGYKSEGAIPVTQFIDSMG